MSNLFLFGYYLKIYRIIQFASIIILSACLVLVLRVTPLSAKDRTEAFYQLLQDTHIIFPLPNATSQVTVSMVEELTGLGTSQEVLLRIFDRASKLVSEHSLSQNENSRFFFQESLWRDPNKPTEPLPFVSRSFTISTEGGATLEIVPGSISHKLGIRIEVPSQIQTGLFSMRTLERVLLVPNESKRVTSFSLVYDPTPILSGLFVPVTAGESIPLKQEMHTQLHTIRFFPLDKSIEKTTVKWKTFESGLVIGEKTELLEIGDSLQPSSVEFQSVSILHDGILLFQGNELKTLISHQRLSGTVLASPQTIVLPLPDLRRKLFQFRIKYAVKEGASCILEGFFADSQGSPLGKSLEFNSSSDNFLYEPSSGLRYQECKYFYIVPPLNSKKLVLTASTGFLQISYRPLTTLLSLTEANLEGESVANYHWFPLTISDHVVSSFTRFELPLFSSDEHRTPWSVLVPEGNYTLAPILEHKKHVALLSDAFYQEVSGCSLGKRCLQVHTKPHEIRFFSPIETPIASGWRYYDLYLLDKKTSVYRITHDQRVEQKILIVVYGNILPDKLCRINLTLTPDHVGTIRRGIVSSSPIQWSATLKAGPQDEPYQRVLLLSSNTEAADELYLIGKTVFNIGKVFKSGTYKLSLRDNTCGNWVRLVTSRSTPDIVTKLSWNGKDD
jgi:hypothetical protein